MKNSLYALLILGLMTISSAVNATTLRCSEDAIIQAEKLLIFHFGEDDRIEIDPIARALPAVQNPANKKQKFLVLEVDGYIYKGQYRMRLLYYPFDDSCLLMGQEILELADL